MAETLQCPLCRNVHVTPYAQARDVEYDTSDRVYDFHRCSDCDVVFINPMETERLNVIYPSNYYSFATGDRSTVHRIKEAFDRRNFRKWLAPLKSQPSISVLDVGGGDGWLIDQIAASGYAVSDALVVDIDETAKSRAQAKGYDFHLGPVETYHSDRTFDVILMMNLIEHVPNPRDVIAKAAHLLAPGGLVILKTPNTDALDARLFRNRNWGGYHTPRHFVLFTLPSISRLVSDAGLTVKVGRYTQGAPFWAVSITSSLADRGWLKVDYTQGIHEHWMYKLSSMAAAAFDLARSPFSKTSQVFLICTKP